MVYVKRFFIILLIIMLLTYNIGFCADTLVNFNGVATNNFYLMLSRLNDINAITSTYIPGLYNILSNINVYTQYIYKYKNNFTMAENYILNEQDNLQDYFIRILENDEDLRNLFKNNQDLQVYGHINAPYPNAIIYIIYSDKNDHNAYQSNPYSNIIEHKNFTVPYVSGTTATTLLIDVVTSRVAYDGFVTYNKNGNVLTKYLTNTGDWTIPTCCLGYRSNTFRSYLLNLYGFDPTLSAINDNTKAIKESTDRILSEQSDNITDTGVTDSTTDNSPNLQSTFNTMSNAFTSRNTSTKTFVFTLPNGQSYNFTLANNLLTNMLRGYGNTFYAFYQAIFWCIFGGYVLFDFKRIINKFKGGDIDTVVSSSSPIDNVVKASLG